MLPVYWLLVMHMQHLGLALASSVGIAAFTLILFGLLSRKTHNPEMGAMTGFFLKVCGASIVTGWICRRLVYYLAAYFDWRSIMGALVVLVIVTTAGMLLLLIAAKLLRIRELDGQIARFRRLALLRSAKG
jgi:hypothetical protein